MNQEVTIVMPVSRDDYVDAIFPRLELLDCNREKTNLLVVVDGNTKLYTKVRNLVNQSKFNEKLCIEFKSKHKLRQFDLQSRRLRISDIHNLIKEQIIECDYVFGLEDDTIFPTTALKKLLQDYMIYPHAGFIQGVQLGRWGIPYVGAWKVDDVYEPKEIVSLKPPNLKTGKTITEVDAGGFFCFLTTKENYIFHNFQPFARNSLGPDVNFGIELRQDGYLNYTDWSITTIHKTKKEDISLANTVPRTVVLRKGETKWVQSQYS